MNIIKRNNTAWLGVVYSFVLTGLKNIFRASNASYLVFIMSRIIVKNLPSGVRPCCFVAHNFLRYSTCVIMPIAMSCFFRIGITSDRGHFLSSTEAPLPNYYRGF
jgi:hypothetical protein